MKPHRNTSAGDRSQRKATEIPVVTNGDIALLEQWWIDHARTEASATIAKMCEYGSGDLVAVGQQVRQLADRKPMVDADAMELGCLFYLIGKMERAISAHKRGDLPSDDTWFDIAVYAKMVLAKRAGVWTT